MADRYWVGGTGNWTDTARWSATSGGASGASIPTSVDNVYFDGASDAGAAFTVTLNANKASYTVATVGTTLTASAVTGTIEVGDTVYLPNPRDSRIITALGTGTGGAGTYIIDRAFTNNLSGQPAASVYSVRDFVAGDGTTVTVLDQTMTLAGSSYIAVFGSWFNPATNFLKTHNSVVLFGSTTTGKIITTNGVPLVTSSFGDLIFNGIGGEWTLGSSLLTTTSGSASMYLLAGSFVTANYSVAVNNIAIYGTTAKSLTLGSSDFTLTAGSPFIIGSEITTANTTINAGTSTIILAVSSTTPTSSFGTGFTYYNIQYSGNTFLNATTLAQITGEFTANNITAIDKNAAFQGRVTFNNAVIVNGTLTAGRGSTLQFSAASTINNLTFNSSGSTGTLETVLGANIVVTGTLSVQTSSLDPTLRRSFVSTILGTPRTITCNAMAIGDSVDFRDITIAGAAAPFNASAKLTGDRGGNTGIIFPAPKTVYWNLAGSQNWSAIAWATTPTGTPAAANFPLVQDTAVITEAGAADTIIMNTGWNIGTLTFDGAFGPRTSAVTFNANNTSFIHGDLKLSSGVNLSNTQGFAFFGRGTQTLTSAGKTFIFPVTLNSVTGTLVLGDNLTISDTQIFTLTTGTLNLNGFILSAGIFVSNSGSTRSIAFGSSKIQVSGSGLTFGQVILNVEQLAGFTYTGTGLFELTYSGGGSTRLIRGPISSVLSTNVPSLSVAGGSDNIAFVAGGTGRCQFRDVTFQSGFVGVIGPLPTIGSNDNNKGLILWGNFTWLPTAFNRGTIDDSVVSLLEFVSPSGTQVLITNASIDGRVTKSDAGTLRLDSTLNMSGRVFTHNQGTVNLNNRILTCLSWFSSNSNIRTLSFGTGQLILTGTGAVWEANTATNYTIIPDAGKIVMSNNTNTARSFLSGGILTYPELEIGGDTGTATTTITGNNGFAKLSSTKLVAHTIVFPNVETRVGNWNVNGSAGNLVTLSRTGASGTFTIRYTGGAFALGRFLSISNSNALPSGVVYAIYSTNGGGNTGWIFDLPAFGKFLTFFTLD